jgi:hypothetical protein
MGIIPRRTMTTPRDVAFATNIPSASSRIVKPCRVGVRVAETIRAHPVLRFVGDVGNKRVSNRV